MASREVFVLADVGGEDYQDYLNFNGSGGGGGTNEEASSMAYYDDNEPRSKSKSKASKKSRARSEPVGEDQMFADMRQRQDDMQHHSLESRHAPAKESAGEYEPANKKIPAKQVAEHQSLMMILQRYAASERFAPKIAGAGVKLTNLESKTVAQLKELQTRVRTICSCTASATGVLGTGILMGCGVIETSAPKRLIDLTGFQSSVGADPEYAALCEQIELDMGFMSTMSPVMRLTFCLGKHAASIANQNNARNTLLARLIAQQQSQQQQTAVQQQPSDDMPVAFSESIPVPAASNQPQVARAGCTPMYD